ncbi:peptidoglycan-binding protein [Streptomyces sp. GZWMJZ-114]|uniref:peptidoglycan-binding protein n=1 Tax=Streptomyces sp. GZWMJZ-114 TaxID=2494734 RepID=UPI00101325C5|nr:peptidoglycan-binding protein [Streptomyces sp. GZWMJZ-114]
MGTWRTTATKVIARARQDRGLGESPAGSNTNKITRWYGIGSGPWCAMAVAYWLHQEGVDVRKELSCPGWAYTPSGVAAARKAGIWHAGASGIKAGDIVFYKLPGAEGNDFVNHVGIITSTGTASVTSIEGNTSNVVAERTRARGLVVGYARPPYQTAPPKPAPKPGPPKFPGRDKFGPGKVNTSVTTLGKQLVRRGYGHYYKVGPGPAWTASADGAATAAFQRAQGWTGKDADGLPGPQTWARLFGTSS